MNSRRVVPENDMDQENKDSVDNNRDIVITTAPADKKKDFVWIRSGSVTLQSLLLAFHIVSNSKFLSMLGKDASAAIVLSFYAVVLGSANACLLSTGIELAKPIADKEYAKVGQLVRASWGNTRV